MLRRASAAASQFEIITPPGCLDAVDGLFWHAGSLARRPCFPHFEPLRALVDYALDRNRGGFAAANAKRGDAALQIVGFHGVQQRHDQPRAGCADGMAERTGAAIDVEL